MKFLIELTTTPQGAAGILQNPEDRSKALEPIFKAAGCKLEQYYFSLLGNKVYLIADAPDLDTLYPINVVTQAGGAVSSIDAVPIMTASEAVESFKNAASIVYQPPGK